MSDVALVPGDTGNFVNGAYDDMCYHAYCFYYS